MYKIIKTKLKIKWFINQKFTQEERKEYYTNLASFFFLGFQRPVLVYTKPDTATATPYGLESRGVTPFTNTSTPNRTPGHPLTPFSTYNTATPQSDLASPRGFTPKFEMGSTGVTPCSTCENTPNYSYPHSASATPVKTEGSSLEATPQRDFDFTEKSLVPSGDRQTCEVTKEKDKPEESGVTSTAEETIQLGKSPSNDAWNNRHFIEPSNQQSLNNEMASDPTKVWRYACHGEHIYVCHHKMNNEYLGSIRSHTCLNARQTYD